MSVEKFYSSKQNVYSKDNDIFKKNDRKIKNGEDEIDENEFKRLIKAEVSNFVNQSFDNVVVLVGAGASVTDNEFEEDDHGFAKRGVTVAKIADQVLKKLKEKTYNLSNQDEKNDVVVEVFDLPQVAKLSNYSDNILEIDKNNSLSSGFNLEDFLSNLFAYEKFVEDSQKNKLKQTTEAILDIIKKATNYGYDNEAFGHVSFLNVVSKLGKLENKLNIITTNYDTLLEDAAESMQATVFDGFSFSQTPQFDSTMFEWNLVKDVSNIKTRELTYKSKVFNLLKIHGSLTWERSDSGKNIVRKTKESVQNPIMVFPSSDKYAQSYQEPYFNLFAKFQELLKVPNTLFITSGFSFADNHISKMILSAIKTNDGLATLITDFKIDPDKPNDNWKELVETMNDHYQVSFLKATMNSDLAEYLGANPDEN